MTFGTTENQNNLSPKTHYQGGSQCGPPRFVDKKPQHFTVNISEKSGVRHALCGAKILIMRDLEERSRKRREAIETHRTTSWADSEAWDLDFWQLRTPEERLSALVAIHRDIAQVEAARGEATSQGT
jgi:hypothetical protein